MIWAFTLWLQARNSIQIQDIAYHVYRQMAVDMTLDMSSDKKVFLLGDYSLSCPICHTIAESRFINSNKEGKVIFII